MNALSPFWTSGRLINRRGGFLFHFFLLPPSLFRRCRGGFPLSVVIDDFDADNDARIADVSGESSDQLFDVFLAFAAETAA